MDTVAVGLSLAANIMGYLSSAVFQALFMEVRVS
jgi:hypothetical protein